MALQHESTYPHVEMTQITHEIYAVEAIHVYTAVATIIQQYGGEEKQMYFIINRFYQTDAYPAITDMIPHLMESYRHVMNFRGMLINHVALTVIRNDDVSHHAE